MEQTGDQQPGNSDRQKDDDVVSSGTAEDNPGSHANDGKRLGRGGGATTRNRWKEFIGAGTDRHLELILAFAITFFAAAQWITSCRNDARTSDQVAQIIKAANRIDGAADRFSTSAQRIDDGMHDAVGKLNLQATHLGKSAVEARRLANETENVAKQAQNGDRAWVGVQRITLLSYTPNKPLAFSYDLVNSGKTPAINVRLEVKGDHFFMRGWTREQIDEEIAKADKDWTLDPVAVIPPQGASPNIFNAPEPLPQPFYNGVVSGEAHPYVLGRVEYDDVLGRHQWLTFCIDVEYQNSSIVWNYCPAGNAMSY